jgi:PAS domain S-box-containing protein
MGTVHAAGTSVPLDARLRSLRRLALAAVHPGGATLYDDLMRELCEALGVAAAFVTVFTDETCAVARTLAGRLDGRSLATFEYPLDGSPCAKLRGRAFRYVAAGVATEFPPGTIFGAKGMDSYAGVPLADSTGAPLGMLVVMDRIPVAGGDAEHAEAMLKIVAGRLAAEIERARTDEVFRATALAVSGAGSATVFDELVRLLASLTHVEIAFVARHQRDDPDNLAVLAMIEDGQLVRPERYAVQGTPCSTVLGQQFRAYPRDLTQRFPDDIDARRQCLQSYAGYPLSTIDGAPLGIVAVASRRPMTQVERIESTLKIFAVRAAAEIERLAASEALQRSEASYRAIFEAAEDAIFIHDWDSGAIVDVNAKAAEVYGWTREEMKRLTVADFSAGVPPYTAAEALHWIQLAKLGRCPPVEWHRRNQDGSLHWDEVRLKPALIDGRPHILAFTREITERKAALAALQASEEQYRAIFNAAADALVLRDAAFRIVDVNETYERMSGWRRDEVLGVDRIVANPPDVAPAICALHEQALAGELIELEVPLVRRDGTRYEIELRGVPIRHRGEPHVLYMGRDVTERKRAERALRDSEEQYRAIFNASADALILWNSRFQRVDVNEAYERMYGWSRDDVIGRGYDAPHAGEEYARPRRELVRRALAGEACSAELEALRKDGQRIVTEVHAIPFRHRGEPHVLAIARDITERRHAERRREELERQLRQAQKMEAIGQLTGGIAHDFNNILTSVIGYLVMAEERAEATADATLQRQLGQAHLAAQRARDLIARMLAFARRQRGERRPLALAPLVRQTLQLLRSTLPSTVEIDAAGIALADDGPPVTADAVQLEQVLFNLCINARDAMDGHGRIGVRLQVHPRGGGWHCASCRAVVPQGAWVELVVADSGTGIALALLERIFDPFFSTKAPGQGSGMGLAMVHGIVHDHGGHLQVTTAPGRGAVFGVWLPLAEASLLEAEIAPAAATAGVPALRGRVLVVEDDPMVGDFLVERLAGWGLDVTLQRDPVAAAAWLDDASHEVDLLLTDQTMPQLTGLQLARHAHAARPALPVVLVSGNAAAFDAGELAAGGIRVALAKPVDAARLRTVLGDLLQAGGR